MKSKKLLDALGDIDSQYIKEAQAEGPVKKQPFYRKRKWLNAAAVLLVFVIGGTVVWINKDSLFSQGFVDSATEESGSEDGATAAVTNAYLETSAEDDAETTQRSKIPETTTAHETTPSVTADYVLTQAVYPTSLSHTNAKGTAALSIFSDFLSVSASKFLQDSSDTNCVYAPLNVYMALAMLSEITDGSSRQQILELLGVDSIKTLRTLSHDLWTYSYKNDDGNSTILASSVWLNKNISYNRNTLQTLADQYYASTFQGEMGSSDYDSALQSWLNEQTSNLLSKQVSELAMEADTSIDLATTIYYHANWTNAFSELNTVTDTFHSTTGDESCKFMNQTYTSYYVKQTGFQAVSKQLLDSSLMWFILPDEDVSIDSLLESGAITKLVCQTDYSELDSGSIALSVPKFDVSSKQDLAEGLKELGVTDVFDENASDYTPLLDESTYQETPEALKLYVSQITHAARVSIDEEACTAAAYTDIELTQAAEISTDPFSLKLDRPFIFAITNNDGLTLFLGIVNHVA
jgi:serpin B